MRRLSGQYRWVTNKLLKCKTDRRKSKHFNMLISVLFLNNKKGQQNGQTSSGIVQKYLALRSGGEAHVSRSSSLVNLLNHRSSQLQWRGLPPKLNTREERGEPLDLAYTGILRNSGSGGIFFSLFDVMSSLKKNGKGGKKKKEEKKKEK